MNNIATITGRLVGQPEGQTLENGTLISHFTIASTRDRKQKDGNYGTDFIDCVLFGNAVSNFTMYCQKGDLIQVVGRLETSVYTDKNQVKRKATVLHCSSWYLLGGVSHKKEEANQEIASSVQETPGESGSNDTVPESDFSLEDLGL